MLSRGHTVSQGVPLVHTKIPDTMVSVTSKQTCRQRQPFTPHLLMDGLWLDGSCQDRQRKRKGDVPSRTLLEPPKLIAMGVISAQLLRPGWTRGSWQELPSFPPTPASRWFVDHLCRMNCPLEKMPACTLVRCYLGSEGSANVPRAMHGLPYCSCPLPREPTVECRVRC